MKKQFLEIGRIVSTSGIKGEVRVQPWSDTPDFLQNFDTLYFDEGETPVELERARSQKGIAILKLAGVDDIDAANALRGRVLYVNRDDIRLGERTYFIQDLIGLTVVDADDSSLVYGELSEISPTGANDVYHVTKDGRTVLIPAIRQVVIETDIEGGVMRIRPLEGLFDDEN